VPPENENLTRPSTGRPSLPVTNLPLVEESQADSEVALLYASYRSRFGRPEVPGILKCFATHPPLLRSMMDLAEGLLFADGCLVRRQKEMIATFVSAQNACPYCADSHGYFPRANGGSAEALEALQRADPDSPALSQPEQALLHFVEKINRSSCAISRSDVEHLEQSGWSEPQIAEAVHIAALFATFNRVANAFGLQSQGLLQPDDRTEGSSRSRNAQGEGNTVPAYPQKRA
jgi:uncharacterized peroxidase-related enzyme